MARGNFGQSVLAGLQVGGQLRRGREGIKLAQQKRQDARDIQMAKVKREVAAANVVSKIFTDEKKDIQSRGDALKTMQSFTDLVNLPNSVRGPQVDSFVQEYQQKFQVSLAPNVVDMLKKGKKEDVAPLLQGLSQKIIGDGSANMETINPILSNPRASAQAIIGFNKESLSVQGGSSPAPGLTEITPQQKAQSELSRIDTQRNKLLQAQSAVAGTEQEKTVAKMIARLDKREKFLLKAASPLGKLVEDFRQGRLTNDQLALGMANEAKKSGGKRTIQDIVVPIIDKVGRLGVGGLTKNEVAILGIARNLDVLGLTINNKMNDILNKSGAGTPGRGASGNRRPAAGGRRPAGKNSRPKIKGSSGTQRKALEDKLIKDNPGFDRNSKEIQDAVNKKLGKR